MAELPKTHDRIGGEETMLTPYVTGLVFANCITAVCLVAVIGALSMANNHRPSYRMDY